MDVEYSIIFFIQLSVLTVFWPQYIRSFSRWKNRSLRNDNPNLNTCYYLRMWGTPLFVFIGSMIFLPSLSSAVDHELIDKILISLFVLLGSAFTGAIITEYFVDRFKTHYHNSD